jgi:hypothetical protein
MKRIVSLILVLVVMPLLAGCIGGAAETTASTQEVVTTSSAVGTPTSGASGAETTDASSADTTGGSSVETLSTTSTNPSVSFENASVFTAELSGAEVVPAVETLATGSAIFKIDPTGTRGYFKLTLSNVTDVFASRVHEGLPGSDGQGLLILYPGPTLSGPYTGVIAQGYFDASALIGSLAGGSLAEFAILLQSGKAYVNVGTLQNPEGEIRGQIHEELPTEDGRPE